MSSVAKYAIGLSLFLAASLFTVPNADAVADWGRQHLEPTLGKDWGVIAIVLVIGLPPTLLVAVCARGLLALWGAFGPKRGRNSN